MPQKNSDPFSIPPPVVLHNAEDLQEFESSGGLICIKCAHASKQASKVQNLRLTFWITWLSTWKMNPANFSSFLNMPESSPCFGVPAKCGNCEDCFYDVKLGSFLLFLQTVIYNIKLMPTNRKKTMSNPNFISKAEKNIHESRR